MTRQAVFSGFFQPRCRERTRAFDQRAVGGKVAETKRRQTALLLAEQLARASRFQVLLGDAEAVGGLLHHFQSPPRLLRLDVGDQNALGFMRPSPDSYAQLMQ